MPDDELMSQCDVRSSRAGGPGGQRRNKVFTGVVLVHRPTGMEARAEESRSRETNRRRALGRLRRRIAARVRCDPPRGPDGRIRPYLDPQGRLRINPGNPDYPLVAAAVLDALRACNGSYARAADGLGASTSQVVKFLQRESWLARAAREVRGG